MGYRNAEKLLPADLLSQVQQYADGECLYIPRSRKKTNSPGPATQNSQRNREICRRYAAGHTVRHLAQEFYLSPQAIYKILAKDRK